MEQRLWVTAYSVSGCREILQTQHPHYDGAVLFSFDDRHIAYPVNAELLHDYRKSGAQVQFYSIPDPF